jgi:hypothetical protein
MSLTYVTAKVANLNKTGMPYTAEFLVDVGMIVDSVSRTLTRLPLLPLKSMRSMRA